MLDEPLCVVDRRAGESEALAVDFSAIFEKDAPGFVEHFCEPVLEPASSEADDAGIGGLHADEPRAVRNKSVPERLGEALPVADRAGLRVACAARREKHVLREYREAVRDYGEARGPALDGGDLLHRAVRDDRHLLVAQQVAEGVDYRRRLFVRREDAPVGHSLRPHAERLEPAADLPRRTFAHRLGDELGAPRGDSTVREIGEKLIGRYVLREVAAAVRSHQHL